MPWRAFEDSINLAVASSPASRTRAVVEQPRIQRPHPVAKVIAPSQNPRHRQLALNPGQQLPYIPYENFVTIGALLGMQAAYWYRLQRVPIPFQGSNLILNHLLLLLGRLSIIFGGALFSVVFFRHLPELDQGIDVLVISRRGLLLGGAVRAVLLHA
jgi:hypothetical protein